MSEIQNGSYLEHHGVDGQQWGVRNGPPYPLVRLGREKFSKIVKKRKIEKAKDKNSLKKLKETDPEAYEAKKQKAITSGSGKEVLNFQGDLTIQQLQDAAKRLELEKKIKDLSPSEVKKGLNIGKKLSDTAKVTADMAKAGKAIAEMSKAIKGLEKKDKEENSEDKSEKKEKPKKDNEPMDGEYRQKDAGPTKNAFDPAEWLRTHPENGYEEPKRLR